MGRILTLLGLKRRAFAAINGRQEVSVSDDEAAGVEASLAKADAACLTAGDVLGCSIAGAAVSLAADGYADGRLVPEASVTVTKKAEAVMYSIKPGFAGYKCQMVKGDGRYDVRFQMSFSLSPPDKLSGVRYDVKYLHLYKTDSLGGGINYIEFSALLFLDFDGNHNMPSSASMYNFGASVPVSDATVSVTDATVSGSLRVVTLTYTVVDRTGVATLDEFYPYTQNGYYRLHATCASADGRVTHGDAVATT